MVKAQVKAVKPMFGFFHSTEYSVKTEITREIFMTKLQCATVRITLCDKSHKQTRKTWLLVTDDDIIGK